MDLIILAPWDAEPTTRLLLAAAERLGVDVTLEIAGESPPPEANAGAAPLLPRIGFRRLRSGIRSLRRHERSGNRPLNASAAVLRAKNKRNLVAAGLAGVSRPPSAVCRVGRPLPAGLDFPVVSKPLHGARGEGIRLLRRSDEWSGFEGGGRRLVERFLDPSSRREFRLLILEGELLAATERFPAAGDFRANRAAGASEVAVDPLPSVLREALVAARWFGLGLAGIDVVLPLEEPIRPLILDVNDSPGLVGISETTGRDLAFELLHRWLPAKRSPVPTRAAP